MLKEFYPCEGLEPSQGFIRKMLYHQKLFDFNI